MRWFYLTTMTLIFSSSIVVDSYHFFNPTHQTNLYKTLNIITPIIMLLNLLIFIKKKIILKNVNGQIHKIFGKN